MGLEIRFCEAVLVNYIVPSKMMVGGAEFYAGEAHSADIYNRC